MKVTHLWAWIALFNAPAVLAQATETSAPTTTTSSTAPTCTASPIASICNYPEPGVEFAIASDSRASCWEYCNTHTPCNFVIFVAGNPNTGTGTCWLYPGENYDASASSSDCGNPSLFVYGKPECTGGSPTATSAGACPATATPSAVASVCGYPQPGTCFYECTASEGASDCLSQCVQAESCSYVVFNPHNPSNSPYASGTCWMYANGTYNAQSASTCSGDPEQYVYQNTCPKPPPSASTSSSPSSSSLSPSAGANTNGRGTTDATTGSIASSIQLASNSRSLIGTLSIGMAVFVWQWV